jgi:putative ABC transport system permease protein
VLVNETAARLMGFPHPVGARIKTNNQELTIICVFKDFVLGSPFKKTPPMPTNLNPDQDTFLSIRLAHGHSVAASIATIGTILKRIDPEYPPVVHFVDQDFARNYFSKQRVGALATIFGSLAVLISCMGLFGLATFAAEQRVKEIGIRKVMETSALKITGTLSADFLKLAALIAFPLGWMGMHRWLQQFDYRVEIGWKIFAAAGMSAALIVLATVSMQECYQIFIIPLCCN